MHLASDPLEHIPTLDYEGDIGRRSDWVARGWDVNSLGWLDNFIYHLFDRFGELVYIGRTGCPLYRFETHRRKWWWYKVSHVVLYKVTCEHRGCDQDSIERITNLWETRTIRALMPAMNISCNPAKASVTQ